MLYDIKLSIERKEMLIDYQKNVKVKKSEKTSNTCNHILIRSLPTEECIQITRDRRCRDEGV